MILALRPRVWLVAALLLGATVSAYAQPLPGVGVIVTTAQMYLAPDVTRVPLATLATGTQLRVLTREGDWYRVIYRDRYLGDRTGYVHAVNVRIEAAAPPGATPAPPVPGQVAPATPPQPPPAPLPPPPLPEMLDRGYVWLSGGVQDSTAFTAASTFTQSGGTGTITTNHEGASAFVADMVIGQRFRSGFSISVGVTRASQVADATIMASVPSPVPGLSNRSVSGIAPDIRRSELAFHLDAAIAVPARGRMQVAVFAGPSLFRVKQGLVTGVTVNETPPFTTAMFANATVTESRKHRIGVNAGIEASVRVWRALGVGILVRYSRATLTFSPAPGTDVEIKAGGLQVAAGLHFRLKEPRLIP